MPPPPHAPRADLVLEGGGVKGLALIGAVAELGRAGYSVPRVAGSSAGAVTGALVAALQQAGEPLSRLDDVWATLDLRRVARAPGPLGRVPLLGTAVAGGLNLLLDEGLYEAVYLRDWLSGVLGELGVERFGDLRLSGEEALGVAPDRAWRLVVTASDVSRRRLVRLPWDHPVYGLDPDEQRVVDAVLASTAIPFFFEPVRLRDVAGQVSTLVDGGLLSNFPVALFDLSPGLRPRWPTFGVRLTPSPAVASPSRRVDDPLTLAFALVDTFLTAGDAPYADDACVVRRTVYVDTDDVGAVDFGLPRERQLELVARGAAAARTFLARFDLEDYLRSCRPDALDGPPPGT